jgi:hypothetical protein
MSATAAVSVISKITLPAKAGLVRAALMSSISAALARLFPERLIATGNCVANASPSRTAQRSTSVIRSQLSACGRK